jgi:hypothetical protein
MRPFPKDYEKDLIFNLNSQEFHFTILLTNKLFSCKGIVLMIINSPNEMIFSSFAVIRLIHC